MGAQEDGQGDGHNVRGKAIGSGGGGMLTMIGFV